MFIINIIKFKFNYLLAKLALIKEHYLLIIKVNEELINYFIEGK